MLLLKEILKLIKFSVFDAAQTDKIKIPEHLVKEYGQVLLTKELLGKYQEEEITATELARLAKDQLKDSISTHAVESAHQAGREIANKWDIESFTSWEQAEKLLWDTFTSSYNNKKNPEGKKVVTEVIKN